MVFYNALPIGRLWNKQTLYAQKWEDRISGEFVSKYIVFSHKGGVRTLVVNPKDLNKDRGLTKWVLYCYLPYWFLKSSYMMFLLVSFEWSRSSIVFFMGAGRRGTHNMRGPLNFYFLGRRGSAASQTRIASFFLQATSDEVVGVFKAYAIGLLDNSDIFKSNARAPMCACVTFYGIQDSRKFSICGKRRKCGKPNSHASFILQATSDEMRVLLF